MCDNVSYTDFVFGVRMLFVEKDCCCTVCDQAPILHGAMRLEIYVSRSSVNRSRGTYNSLKPPAETILE